MFRALIPSIFRSTRLCVTARGIMHSWCCRPVAWKRSSSASRLPTGIIPVHYTTSCNTQYSAPEDGRDQRPKHVELIGFIYKPLLLHLVGVYIILITFMCWLSWNLGLSTSWNPQGLYRDWFAFKYLHMLKRLVTDNYWGVEVEFHLLLYSVLNRYQSSASKEGMYHWETKRKSSKPISSTTNHMKTWFNSEYTQKNSEDKNPFQKPESLSRSRNSLLIRCPDINPYRTAFPYGNGMVLHFYQQQESSTTKTVHRVINKGLKTYV